MKDSTVTVNGGEILVRCIIPVGEDDGQTVPVYVNVHGGGEYSSLTLDLVDLRRK